MLHFYIQVEKRRKKIIEVSEVRIIAYITIFKMALLNFLNFIFLIKPPAQLNIFKCSPVILQLVNHISTKQQQKNTIPGTSFKHP